MVGGCTLAYYTCPTRWFIYCSDINKCDNMINSRFSDIDGGHLGLEVIKEIPKQGNMWTSDILFLMILQM